MIHFMRLYKQFFLLSILSTMGLALFASVASAKSSTVQGVVKQVKASKDSLSLKSGKRSLRVRLTSKTQLSGGDRSGDGALGLEDVKKGDQVSVKGTRSGRGLVASSLDNQTSAPEGDDNGDGIPDEISVVEVGGRIVAFNPDQRIVTLAVTDSEDDSLVDTELDVTLPEGAILVAGDRNRDKKRNWDDVRLGDRVMALLVDPVDPNTGAQAMLMVDRDSLSGKKGKMPNLAKTPMGGLVTEVDAEASTVTFQPPRDDLEPVTVRVTGKTEFEVDDVNGDGQNNLSDVSVDDELHVLVDARNKDDLVALKLEAYSSDDFGDDNGDDNGGDQGGNNPQNPVNPQNPRPAPPALGQEFEVKGAIVAPLPDSFLFQVREGLGAGNTVKISFDSATVFEGKDLNGDGKVSLLDCPPGIPAELKLRKVEGGALALKVSLKEPRMPNGGPPEGSQED